jgi:hypothetical protein
MIDNIDFDKLLVDLFIEVGNTKNFISWKKIRSSLLKQRIKKVDPCDIKVLLVDLGLAYNYNNTNLTGINIKWTEEGIKQINLLVNQVCYQ